MNEAILNCLLSPEDGTPLSKDLVSETGIKYEITDTGVILLDSNIQRPLDIVYQNKTFSQWNDIVDERIEYYTEKKTIAGKLANLSYKSIKKLNNIPENEIIVDIGCGDGSQLQFLENKKNYIGIDRNIKRLEILKKKYPEATVIYADATKLPFKTGSVHHFYSSNAFEHLWYLKEVVLECYRCLANNGDMTILFPTEGGLWNLGRNVLSKPFFKKRHPHLDFELISHIEHCNNAKQIVRTIETFFEVKAKYLPARIPSVYFNALVEVNAVHRKGSEKIFDISAIKDTSTHTSLSNS